MESILTMDKYFIVISVVIFCIILVIYTQKSESPSSKAKNLKDKVQQAFPNFRVVERVNTIVVSGVNFRNELEEFVTIRIDENQEKNIRRYGSMMIVTYAKEPSEREMKKDILPHLQQK